MYYARGSDPAAGMTQFHGQITEPETDRKAAEKAKSIDGLVAEHDIIERGLSLLESAVARAHRVDARNLAFHPGRGLIDAQ